MNEIGLINCCLPTQREKHLGPPQSILSIASYLSVIDIDSRIYDPQLVISPSNFTPDNLFGYLENISQNIIGLSVWDSVLPKVILATEKLKQKYPNKIIILGGPAASNLQNEIHCNFPWIDFIVKGEAEGNLDNLLWWLNTNRKNMHLLSNKVVGRIKGQKIIGEKALPKIELKDLPQNNYALVNHNDYNKAEIITTRGCPFNCSFCSVNSSWGNKTEFFSLERVFCEIDCLFKIYDDNLINILDDNFGINKKRLFSFCDEFNANYSGKEWSCYFRLADMGEKTIDKMASCGCQGLYVGIETGDNIILNKIQKGFKDEDILSRIKLASKKMNIITSFIWGFPYETYEGFLKTLNTIDEILEISNTIVNLFQLSPLSGTEIINEFGSRITFNQEYISGFVYPPFLAKLTEEELSLIRKHPKVFTAFYHEGSKQFYKKHEAVNYFLGN